MKPEQDFNKTYQVTFTAWITGAKIVSRCGPKIRMTPSDAVFMRDDLRRNREKMMQALVNPGATPVICFEDLFLKSSIIDGVELRLLELDEW